MTLAAFAATPSMAEDHAGSQAVDIDTLRHIPVLHKGRIQPFDTFANIIMAEVCERPKKRNVQLQLEDYLNPNQLASEKFAPAVELFPGGKARKWDGAELIFSWMVEQEKWEDVPFLYAPHPELREVLGVDIQHMKLKYVSPRQVLESEGLQQQIQSISDRREASRQAGEKFIPTVLDERIQKLIDRYQVYRTISFDASKPLTLGPLMTVGSRAEFMMKAELVARLLQETSAEGRTFQSMLQIFAEAPGENESTKVCQATLQAVQSLFQTADTLRRMGMLAAETGEVDPNEGLSLEAAANNAHQFVLASQQLDAIFKEQKLNVSNQFGEMSVQQQENLSKIFREMISKSKELKRLAIETQMALYYSSQQNRSKPFKTFQSPMVIPALNAAALDKNRDTRNSSQPWLSLQTIIYADKIMADYPQKEVQAVRDAWKELSTSYQDRSNTRRAQDFTAAQERTAKALSSLGESLEPSRKNLVKQQLESHQQDDDLIAYTQYPLSSRDVRRLAIEVKYNRINPFQRSFLMCLLALAVFSLAFGKLRKHAFHLGVATCLLTLLWTAYGFYLRIMITGWAPVTNMYETVIWVPFVTLALATWFLLWPLTRTGMKNAWRLTAIPGSWEASELTENQLTQFSQHTCNLFGFASTLARLAIMAGLFYFLTMMPLGDGGRPYFRIVPDLEATQGHMAGLANTLGVWGVGLGCVLASIWLLPRLIICAPMSLVLVPSSWRHMNQLERIMDDVYKRKSFALAGTGLACICFLLACMAPNDALDENISALQPVLRTNFWLTIHVLCIVSSYSAGALAMGLGNLALFHYLLGQYRPPVTSEHINNEDTNEETTPRKKPSTRAPEACGPLANYAYKAIQIAVLLLAAGTILGGLWADVSWGRFWGWDPKEVWALISLLVYLAILHGRYAGWFSNFGLIFGTVLGATMIVMSWYGVNFVLPMLSPTGEVGLHSYGTGAGGLEYVAGFVLLNWVFLAAATARYVYSTR